MVVEAPARRHTWWRNLKDASHATSLRKQSHLSGEDKDGGVIVRLTLAGDNGMP